MAKSTQSVAKAGPKTASFLGSSLDDLRDFPRDARREAGFQLDNRRIPSHVRCEIFGVGLRAACLSEEDTENRAEGSRFG
jgi:hypothetical protein